LKDEIIMLYNSHVSGNGSSLLRNVWRINTPGDNPFMRSEHITNPFVENTMDRKVFRATFIATQDLLCTGRSEAINM